MAEKILNTRIQLKYDTLANWNSSTFKLKVGELAIVTLGENVDGSRWPKDEALEKIQHPVLFKVGDGNHTFSQLPFASALAADVYAWAKASDVKLEGKTIKFVGTDKAIEIPYITEAEVNALLAGYKTKQIAYSNTGSTIQTITSVAQNENGEVTVTYENIAFPVVDTGVMSITGDKVVAATTDVNGAVTLETKLDDSGNVKLEKTDNGLKATVEFPTYTLAPGGNNGTVKFNDTEVKVTGLDSAAYAKVEDFDVAGAAAEVLGAEADDASKNTVYGAKAAAAKAQADIDAFFAAADTTEKAIDTLKEIQDFLASDDGTVQVLVDKVDANETAIGEIIAGTKEVGNAAKLGNKAASEYLLKTDAPGYGDILTTTVAASTYQPKGDYQPAGNYKTIQEAVADPTADGLTLDFIASISQDANGKITVTKKTVDGDVFASASDGTLARTAIQSVTAPAGADGTPNGLVAETDASNNVTIGIDDTVVFVFDCGSATKNIG